MSRSLALVTAGLSLAALVACSSGSPEPSGAAKAGDTKTVETKTVVTTITETKGGDPKTSDKIAETKTTDTKSTETAGAPGRDQTVAKSIKWENEKWIPLNRTSGRGRRSRRSASRRGGGRRFGLDPCQW